MPCSMDAEEFLMQSPIGEVKLIVCRRGLHSLNQIGQNDSTFFPNLSTPVKMIREGKVDKDIGNHIQEVESWFKVYFAHPQAIASINLPKFCLDSVRGECFLKIWMALAHNIHPGQKVFYSDLAVHAGFSKGGAQLVGQAMAENPFQIIIPCHRVVPKSGSVGQYSRGKKNKVKEWLLKFEGCEIDEVKKRKKNS